MTSTVMLILIAGVWLAISIALLVIAVKRSHALKIILHKF